MSAPSFTSRRFALLRMARRDPTVTLGPYKVLDAMLDAADRETGACFTGHQYLQAETGLSLGGVRKAIDALKASGWISIDKPTRGRGNANDYSFGFQKLTGTNVENCPDRGSFPGEKTVPTVAENCPEKPVKLSSPGHPSNKNQLRAKGPLEAAPLGGARVDVMDDDISPAIRAPEGASSGEIDLNADCPIGTAPEEPGQDDDDWFETVDEERERLELDAMRRPETEESLFAELVVRDRQIAAEEAATAQAESSRRVGGLRSKTFPIPTAAHSEDQNHG